MPTDWALTLRMVPDVTRSWPWPSLGHSRFMGDMGKWSQHWIPGRPSKWNGAFSISPHITNACMEFHTLSFKPEIRLDSGHSAENSKNQKVHVTQKLLQSSLTLWQGAEDRAELTPVSFILCGPGQEAASAHPEKKGNERASQCWAISEHGGGGPGPSPAHRRCSDSHRQQLGDMQLAQGAGALAWALHAGDLGEVRRPGWWSGRVLSAPRQECWERRPVSAVGSENWALPYVTWNQRWMCPKPPCL